MAGIRMLSKQSSHILKVIRSFSSHLSTRLCEHSKPTKPGFCFSYQFTNNSRIIVVEHIVDDILQIRLANHVGEFDFQVVRLQIFGDAREDCLVVGFGQGALIVDIADLVDVVILHDFETRKQLHRLAARDDLAEGFGQEIHSAASDLVVAVCAIDELTSTRTRNHHESDEYQQVSAFASMHFHFFFTVA